MKHKLAGLQSLVQMLHERGVGQLKARKPLLSVHVEKNDDDQDEESLLHEKMESPLEEKGEDDELGRKSRFGR